MDSCHLFNFLFGTKKATTELSKCFSSVVSSSSGKSSQSSTRNNNARQKQHNNCKSAEAEPPLTPLKQLQMKIASLAPGSKRSKSSISGPEIKKNTSVTCDAKCGTYRATLVELSEDNLLDNNHQIGDDDAMKIDHEPEDVNTIENPLNIDRKEAGNLVIIGSGNVEKEETKRDYSDNENQALDTESSLEQAISVTVAKDNNIDMNLIKTKQPARCKRVILYDDCELKQQQTQNQHQHQNQHQQQQQQSETQQCQGQPIEPVKRSLIVASAEVYNMVVGDNKEKRAELRRVSSFVPDECINKDSNNNNNCNGDKVDGYVEDKGLKEYHPLAHQASNLQEQLQQPSEYDNNNNNNTINSESNRKKSCESLRDKRSVYVQSLVQSIELTGGFKAVTDEETTATSTQKEGSLNIGINNYSAKNINIWRQEESNISTTKQIELQHHNQQQQSNRMPSALNNNNFTKPVTFVKPLPPPKTPVKINKAKCLNMQISLNKPIKIQHLFQDESFLIKFFGKLDPLDRCVAAQVCRQWRDILYANQNYWKDLINVIDCTQLRRDYLVECIINTLQSAKTKQQKAIEKDQQHHDNGGPTLKSTFRLEQKQFDSCTTTTIQTGFNNNKNDRHFTARFDIKDQVNSNCNNINRFSGDSLIDFDQDDVWRIQELCNRYTQRTGNFSHTRHQANNHCNDTAYNANIQSNNYTNNDNQQQQQQQQQQQHCSASKSSSSLPSQISSTLSSVSLSSLLSPLSESSRIESIKEKLYNSLDNRGFDAICLFGATDDDIEDLISKMPVNAHKRITCGRLNNCCITNGGLDLFISAFTQIEEIELSGCNEITNCFDLKVLTNLKRLVITDCINIADGVAQKLIQIMHQLDELTIQAYHLTDAFIEYLSLNSDTTRLKRLELPNCKEITNQSIVTIAKYFLNLELLSISGSTKITDDGIEVLAEQARKLKSLDLSWCSRITDASLECIACDLGDTLTDLILDRNVHITDIGLGYLATMSKLTLLHIRWCPQITDIGLESILSQVKTLRYLSLAGLHQITARSLLYLIEADSLEEVELTNCPSVNTDLLLFLSTRMPKCNIIF